MDVSVQLILCVLGLSAVRAHPQDKGPQTFETTQPQYAQRYKEVIMYLTPTQIKNYEAGHGLPNLNYEQQSQAPLAYEPEKSPQLAPSFTYETEPSRLGAPRFIYKQQKSQPQIINEEEGKIIQSTLDILEANKMQFQLVQQNTPKIEFIRAEEEQDPDIRPIKEPDNENEEPRQIQILQNQPQQQQQQLQKQQEQQQLQQQFQQQLIQQHHEQQFQQKLQQQQSLQEQHQQLLQQTQQQVEQSKLIEEGNKQQEQFAKSFAYIHFFSNQKPDNSQKIQIFHPEPQSVNLDEEIRLQKENNIEIQQDPLLRKKFKLIPYEYLAEQNTQEQVRDDLLKQGQTKVQQQLFVPAENDWKPITGRPTLQKEYEQQYAPQFSIPSNNKGLDKIIQEIELERQAAKIHAANIANSPPIVINKEISIIKRRPVQVIKHVNIPYPAPFFVPVPNPVEVKVPQPYAVPVEIIRHVPVPIIKTETVEVEKPVPYEVERQVPEFVEKKVYVPVEKPYTVERIVPVEVKKEIPVQVPVNKPDKFTIIRHLWKH